MYVLRTYMYKYMGKERKKEGGNRLSEKFKIPQSYILLLLEHYSLFTYVPRIFMQHRFTQAFLSLSQLMFVILGVRHIHVSLLWSNIPSLEWQKCSQCFSIRLSHAGQRCPLHFLSSQQAKNQESPCGYNGTYLEPITQKLRNCEFIPIFQFLSETLSQKPKQTDSFITTAEAQDPLWPCASSPHLPPSLSGWWYWALCQQQHQHVQSQFFLSQLPLYHDPLWHKGIMVGMVQKDSYAGNKAQNKGGTLILTCPLEPSLPPTGRTRGRSGTRATVSVKSRDPHPPTQKLIVKKMAQTIFETFSTPAVYLNQGCAIPVTHFYHWHHYILQQQGHPHCPSKRASLHPTPSCIWTWLAGDLTDYPIKILTPRGYGFATMPE